MLISVGRVTKQFQSLVRQLHLSGKSFDLSVFVMSLSRFRAQPTKGHHARARRIFGYLSYLSEGAIRFRTGEPGYSDIKDQEYDWTSSAYRNTKEFIPEDISEPKGNYVVTKHYVDANLCTALPPGNQL